MEKRKNTRVPFTIKSTVRYNGSEIPGEVLNMSLQGMFIDISEPIPVGTEVSVTMCLKSANIEKGLELKSRVVRSDPDGTAIKLMELNLDLCIALRDLMIDNSGDSDALMNEFYDFVNTNRVE